MINLFISLSLIGSAAFPPSNALDTNFSLLMSDPQQALAPLVQADQEAAAMLHHRLTGYATLRNFYKLRDETFDLKETQDHSLQTGERTMKAFTALLAIINSAANKISGGLYDETTEAVVPLNGLIVLLGEAIIFVNREFISTFVPQTSNQTVILANFRLARIHKNSTSPRLYISDESGRKSPGSS